MSQSGYRLVAVKRPRASCKAQNAHEPPRRINNLPERTLARLAWGARGPGFKSRRPDQLYAPTFPRITNYWHSVLTEINSYP
jgi:hypothetical protein